MSLLIKVNSQLHFSKLKHLHDSFNAKHYLIYHISNKLSIQKDPILCTYQHYSPICNKSDSSLSHC